MKTFLFMLLAVQLAAAINPIIIKGSKFFDSATGAQFFVVGLDYQPSADPLADITALNRDIALFKDLGKSQLFNYETAST